MATLTYEYPVKINGKIYKSGAPVNEQSVAESSKIEQKKVIVTPNSENIKESEASGEKSAVNVELTGMSLQQLKKFAEDNSFDISGCKTKSDIIAAIEKA